ncbi:MAG: hypothetical protein IPN15_18810 [Saprospiraceae bacterium]|nr:hypothetical protein [Candidatus Vicinibacter affinis]
MKTKIFATVSAKLNSSPTHFSSLKFGFLKPVIASIMATLLTLGLPGIVVGQDSCETVNLEGHCLFRNYSFGVSNHSFSIFSIPSFWIPMRRPNLSHFNWV